MSRRCAASLWAVCLRGELGTTHVVVGLVSSSIVRRPSQHLLALSYMAGCDISMRLPHLPPCGSFSRHKLAEAGPTFCQASTVPPRPWRATSSAAHWPMKWRGCSAPLCGWCVLGLPHGTDLDTVWYRVQEVEHAPDSAWTPLQKNMAAMAGAQLSWQHRKQFGIMHQHDTVSGETFRPGNYLLSHL